MRWGLEDESEFAVEVRRRRAGRLEGALSFTCHCALPADSGAAITHRPGHAWHRPGHAWPSAHTDGLSRVSSAFPSSPRTAAGAPGRRSAGKTPPQDGPLEGEVTWRLSHSGQHTPRVCRGLPPFGRLTSLLPYQGLVHFAGT